MPIKVLILDNGEVKVTSTGMQIPEIKRLYRKDTTKNKVFFHDSIAFLFYVFQVFGDEKDGDSVSYLSNHSLENRMIIACSQKLSKKREPNEFLKHDLVGKVIEAYIDVTRTATQKLLITLMEDIHSFTEELSKIPYFIEKEISYEIEDKEGEKRKIKTKIRINNSEQKIKALKDAKELLGYREELIKLIDKEKSERKDSSSREKRLFSEPDIIHKLINKN